ncbi:MAG: CPBP family intramembrane metalloprotease [Clostridia bacterium]|nr:CPBP family intramembrane metalloprotease [Clostridia bacterium]
MRYLIILILMPLIQYTARSVFRFLIPGPYEFWQTYCMIFIQHVCSIGIPLLLLYPKKKYYISNQKERTSIGDVSRFFLLGGCMQLLGTALNYPFSMLLQHFGYTLPPALPNPVDGWELILQTMVVCFTPAILEEILFRQIIYNEIAAYSKRSGIFFSALFFSMAHFDLFNLPATLLIGISLGVLRSRNISLVKCCFVHFVINFSASILNLGFNFKTFSEFFHRYYPLTVFLALVLYVAVFPKGQTGDVFIMKEESKPSTDIYLFKLLKNPLFYLYCILFFTIGVNQL